jgi:cobalt-zinc-cadmium resistance protein CzcA
VLERIEAPSGAQVGKGYELSQPIELRFNELIAGVRGDVAIKLYGDDLDKLTATANRIAAAAQPTPGAADVKVEQTSGAPTLDVKFDRAAIARSA